MAERKTSETLLAQADALLDIARDLQARGDHGGAVAVALAAQQRVKAAEQFQRIEALMPAQADG